MTHVMTALMRGLVDYAGLFPPAALSMDDAVRRYAAYRTSEAQHMLARFVLPVARLNEFAQAAQTVRDANDTPWPLAVLAGADDAATVDAFEASHVGLVAAGASVIEAKADGVATITALAQAFAPRRLVYVELPVSQDPAPLIAELKAQRLRAKIRTGGVTADAFPAAADVLRFLQRCVEYDVPFKATAGLHHPLRGDYPLTYAPDAPRGAMYGFLNVFLAAVLLREGHAASALLPLLEERDPTAISVTPDAISWREFRATTSRVVAGRAQFAGSFGSCSFEEPVQDLAALSLLPALV